MQAVDASIDMESLESDGPPAGSGGGETVGWTRVVRDVLAFQFKLVVDGLKDLCLAQVAVGAAIVDVYRRDGTPGRRFYAIVRLSQRFDDWLALHEPLARVPADAPDFAPPAIHSVDDLLEGVERSARTLVRSSRDASGRGPGGLRPGRRRGGPAGDEVGVAGEVRGRA